MSTFGIFSSGDPTSATTLAIAVSVGVVLLSSACILPRFLKRNKGVKKGRGQEIVILGPSNSGKTVLFHRVGRRRGIESGLCAEL
jgi:ABC-type uncharacterized transport system fused permease/ATPase subunit